MELLAQLLEGTDRRVWAPVRAEDDAEAAARLRATLATLVSDPGMYSDRLVAFAAGLTRPRLGLAAPRLLDFAVDCRWGGRKVGRAQALAAA